MASPTTPATHEPETEHCFYMELINKTGVYADANFDALVGEMGDPEMDETAHESQRHIGDLTGVFVAVAMG
jgi:hypothetical protein